MSVLTSEMASSMASPDSLIRVKRDQDTFKLPDLLPGFELPLSKIFV